MEPIEIPVATLAVKLVMVPATLFIAALVLWWAIPKFLLYLRIVTGRAPRKPGTRTIHLVLGFGIYVLVFVPACIAILIFLSMNTTPPSIVSAEGVAGGGGLLSARKTIRWDEVIRVDCSWSRTHKVNSLRVIGTSKRIELSGGNDLSDIRDLIWSKVPRQAVQPCSVPFGSATGL